MRCNNSSLYFISLSNCFIFLFIAVGLFHFSGGLRMTMCCAPVIAKRRENIIRFIRRDFHKGWNPISTSGLSMKIKTCSFRSAASVPAAVPAGERRLHLPPVLVRKTHSRHRHRVFLRRRLHSEGGLQVSHLPVWGVGQPGEAQLPLGTR